MQPLSSRKIYCHAVAFSLAVGYGCLAIWSKKVGGVQLFPFLVLMVGMSIMLFCLYWLLNKKEISLSMGYVLGWAIVYRLVALIGAPIMEDDQYRFMLDGCAFLEYGTPYGIAPLALFETNSLSPVCADLLNWVNNPDIATIYGPALQVLFAAASFVAPANVDILQLLMVSFDIGIIAILCGYTSPRNVMLYAWCPLVLKEFAFTAHPDVVAVFLLLAAFYLGRLQKPLLAATVLASACAAKVFALILAPFLLLMLPRKSWVTFIVILATWYIPFLLMGEGGTAILGGFASGWQFNPILFLGLTQVFNDATARLLALALFSAVCGIYIIRWWPNRDINNLPRGDILFAVFLLLSPVFNAWYAVWILAFAVIRPAAWSWSFSIALLLTYVTGINWIESGLRAYQMADWAVALEIIIVILAVALDRYKLGPSPDLPIRE